MHRSLPALLLVLAGCGRSPAPVEPPPAPSPPSASLASASLPDGFVLVPAGRYTRGSPASEAGHLENEGPTHDVTISRPFLLGRTEVTVREFREFVAATGHKTDAERSGVGGADNGHSERKGLTWKAPPFPQGDDHPVVEVSWQDAVAYADWRSSQEDLPACAAQGLDCAGYRLPSEGEWEWAARAGTQTAFPVEVTRLGCEPDPALSRIAWTCANSDGHTQPVGALAANAFGLHDMQGNVWEWTSDWFDDYPAGAQIDPAGPKDESDRVVRGGGWGSRVSDVRLAVRVDDEPHRAFDNLGFRLARTAP